MQDGFLWENVDIHWPILIWIYFSGLNSRISGQSLHQTIRLLLCTGSEDFSGIGPEGSQCLLKAFPFAPLKLIKYYRQLSFHKTWKGSFYVCKLMEQLSIKNWNRRNRLPSFIIIIIASSSRMKCDGRRGILGDELGTEKSVSCPVIQAIDT